ncbi:type IV secretion system protein VirB4 [Arsenophonus sp. ENCA]|nr:type IV secretion system protein VirB4 [Arsenophonus sp. ENCA]
MKVKTIKKSFIPKYHSHISADKIFLENKKMMVTFQVEGIQSESLSDDNMVNLFSAQKDFLAGLCQSGNIYLWSHLVKKNVQLDESYLSPDNLFLQRFYDKYASLFSEKSLFVTRYYLTVLTDYDDVYEGEEALTDIVHQIKTALSDYRLSQLACNGNHSAMSGSYLHYLLNHSEEKLPLLTATPIAEGIKNSQFYFGYDVLEIKSNDSDKNTFCTNYVVKDFPRTTKLGQWNFLLAQPYEFIVTQSFIPETPIKSKKKIEQQLNKMASVNDAGVTQQEELLIGQESIINQETLFGSYHCVMSVFGDTPKDAQQNGTKLASEFVTQGRGFRFIKSTSDAPFVYFSHLPMSNNRPLASNRTLTNFSCLMPFHNYSYGKKSGNPIGDGSAIMPLKMVTEGMYYFNTHYSDPHRDVTGQKIAGHALILGATGTGKTTFECSAAGFLQRFDPYLFVIDYNRSTELAVRAFGGAYFSLVEGQFSGLNPFQIGNADDSDLMSFLKGWVKRLAVNNDGSDCNDYEAEEIDRAVDMVMKLPLSERRFSALQHRIQREDLHMKLAKWWDEGALSWAVDSPENAFNPYGYKKVGFDTTAILESIGGKDHPACEAILSVFFFYKKRMQHDGQLMLTIVEEFWKPANYPMTQELIKESLKAGRMKGEMMWLTSQSPEDAINCAICSAIVQQTPTKIFLPNPDLIFDSYIKVGLTEKECRALKALSLESRTMLIKQSGSSTFVKMDLYGFDDFLPVISGSKEGIQLCEKIRHDLNSDNPDDWINPFLKGLKIKNTIIEEVESDNPDIWFPVLMQRLGYKNKHSV